MPLPPVSSLENGEWKGKCAGSRARLSTQEKATAPLSLLGKENDKRNMGQGSWLKRIEITTLPVSLLKRKEKCISKKEAVSKCNIATCSLLPPPSYCRGGERQEPQHRRASRCRDQALLSSEASLGCYFSVFTFNNPKTKHRFHF